MRYPAYPEYKESGVQWLGQVPGHWKVKRLKFVFPNLYSGVSVNSENAPADQESVGVMKTSCVYGNQFIPTENKLVVDNEIDRVACPVTADSLIISRMNTPELVGNCGYVEQDYSNLFLPDRLWIARFSTHQGLHGKYAWYFCISDGICKLTGSLATGTSGSMKNLSQESFLNIEAIQPPLPEQTAIADFLDRETGRIDTLVAKKRRLIALLKEKRTSLISRTVTRGLPEAAASEFGLESRTRFKDSGIEWLGQVPEGWGVKKVRHVARFRGGSTPATGEAQFWDDGDIPWVSPKDMKCGRITDTQDHLTQEGVSQCASGLIKPGHVLIVVRSGILRHSLPVAINDVPVTLNQDMRAFILNDALQSEFLRWFIEGKQKALLENWCKSGTTVESIEMSYLSGSSLPVPPLTEQSAIVDFLDREAVKIDRLVEKVEAAIARLQEYRTALITAAVTGKIDIRNQHKEQQDVA